MLPNPTEYGEGLIHVHGIGEIGYDVPTLWRLAKNAPTFKISSERYKHLLDRKAWSNGDPMSTGADGEHWDRIMEAELKFPIMVRFDRDTHETCVVDGYHRLVKAFLLDIKCISAVDVTNMLFDALISPTYFMTADGNRFNESA